MSEQEYLHTYLPTEQSRLQSQAEFLRPWLHGGLHLAEGQEVLEIGCGVGAQLKILAQHPGVRLTGVDRSEEQLATARSLLSAELARGTLRLVQARAEALPFPDDYFDQALIFFVLEHVSHPLAILGEARRVLKPGGILTVTEVHNASLFVDPPCAALEQYWQAYNRLQRDLGGDPQVGAKLANLCLRSGFDVEESVEIGPVMDARMTSGQRQSCLDFWLGILDSVRPRLLEEGRLSEQVADEAYRELRALASDPEGLLFYAGRRLRARVGGPTGRDTKQSS